MKFLRHIATLLSALFLLACSPEEVSESILPDTLRKQLDLINDAFLARDSDTLREVSATPLSDEEFRRTLEELYSFLPETDFIDRTLVGYRRTNYETADEAVTTTHIAGYQYRYLDAWAFVQLVLTEQGGKVTLQKVSVSPLKQSLRDTNAFTFAGKGVAHYLVFALSILNPIFIAATFVVCFRMRLLKRRKRWLAFILFGAAGATLNWTSGAIDFQLGFIGLLGAGFSMSGALAPVMIQVSFPLGAALFWYFRLTGELALIKDPPPDDVFR